MWKLHQLKLQRNAPSAYRENFRANVALDGFVYKQLGGRPRTLQDPGLRGYASRHCHGVYVLLFLTYSLHLVEIRDSIETIAHIPVNGVLLKLYGLVRSIVNYCPPMWEAKRTRTGTHRERSLSSLWWGDGNGNVIFVIIIIIIIPYLNRDVLLQYHLHPSHPLVCKLG